MNQGQTPLQSPQQSPSQLPMVSHAEIAEGSRRAPSVSSRTTRSRQHHRGQSHHGGSNHLPRNEFPFFEQTGDVEIVIACDGQEKRYLLHKLILAQFSGFFEAGMSDQWSRAHAIRDQQSRPEQALTVIGEESTPSQAPSLVTPEQISPSSQRKRWRYELDWANLGDDDEPMLVQKVSQNLEETGASTDSHRLPRWAECSLHRFKQHHLSKDQNHRPIMLPFFDQWQICPSLTTTQLLSPQHS